MNRPEQVFVVGNSRSGTTMLANMLGRHSAMGSLREMHFFEQLWTSADRDRALSAAEATELAARLLHNQRTHVRCMAFHRGRD